MLKMFVYKGMNWLSTYFSYTRFKKVGKKKSTTERTGWRPCKTPELAGIDRASGDSDKGHLFRVTTCVLNNDRFTLFSYYLHSYPVPFRSAID